MQDEIKCNNIAHRALNYYNQVAFFEGNRCGRQYGLLCALDYKMVMIRTSDNAFIEINERPQSLTIPDTLHGSCR